MTALSKGVGVCCRPASQHAWLLPWGSCVTTKQGGQKREMSSSRLGSESRSPIIQQVGRLMYWLMYLHWLYEVGEFSSDVVASCMTRSACWNLEMMAWYSVQLIALRPYAWYECGSAFLLIYSWYQGTTFCGQAPPHTRQYGTRQSNSIVVCT